jgi:hypothetical protein
MAPHHAARRRFRVVSPDADPETELTFLFAQEAHLTAQLLDVSDAIEAARQRYRESESLLALPRMELLRTRFGPKPEPRR